MSPTRYRCAKSLGNSSGNKCSVCVGEGTAVGKKNIFSIRAPRIELGTFCVLSRRHNQLDQARQLYSLSAYSFARASGLVV